MRPLIPPRGDNRATPRPRALLRCGELRLAREVVPRLPTDRFFECGRASNQRLIERIFQRCAAFFIQRKRLKESSSTVRVAAAMDPADEAKPQESDTRPRVGSLEADPPAGAFLAHEFTISIWICCDSTEEAVHARCHKALCRRPSDITHGLHLGVSRSIHEFLRLKATSCAKVAQGW